MWFKNLTKLWGLLKRRQETHEQTVHDLEVFRNTLDLHPNWEPLPVGTLNAFYDDGLLNIRRWSGQEWRVSQEYQLNEQDIINAYLQLGQLQRVHAVHDEYYLYEAAKEEEAMATVKQLKNSITIQDEDNRLDVEFVTRKDGTTCFSIMLNDWHFELPTAQVAKLGEFIQSKV